ncbi:MAG: S-layer homology domain-containing protein, partial [Oscillospiraceae bacterium]|nr:S-layer homology domain-containing protein [Oscillospiraceae bacterium]
MNMKRIFTKFAAVLVAVMMVGLFLPTASAVALTYSLSPATVNLDANRSGRFQITVQPIENAAFGGVDFAVSLPADVTITDVSYSVSSGVIGPPGERKDGLTYFGISNLMVNAYTAPMVCTVNIRYAGAGTGPLEIAISEIRLTTYTGETGPGGLDTQTVLPLGGDKVAVVPPSAGPGGDEQPAVTGVTVAPGSASVTRGTTRQFTATVTAVNGAAETVTWQVSGSANAGTTIDATGLLTVAAGETAGTLQVTATSTFDGTKQATAAVTVVPAGGSTYNPPSPPQSTPVVETPDEETPLAEIFPFTDVSEDDWFYGDVYAMWENNLMNGTSPTLFSPNRTLTRGMVVTVLYRAEGSPGVAGLDNPFPDVSAGQYYTDAVLWAAEHEIVRGYPGGGFGPDDNITREQMAAILYRYEQYAEQIPSDISEARAFADGDGIGDYAKEAVAKLVTQGIISGKPNNRFDPR